MNNELYHYGVLGMKWGVRRNRSKSNVTTSKPKKRSINESSNVTTSKPKKRSISELSDDELRSRINRIEMEKRYNDLVNQMNPQQESKAKKFVSKVLERSGENIATQATTYVMGKSVNKLLENIYGDPEAINPKKGQKDK